MGTSAIIGVDRALKDRFYVYRDVVLHQKKEAAEGDQKYLDIKNTPPVISSLQPASVVKNNAFNLGVIGTGFDDRADIFFKGIVHLTNRGGSTALACAIEAANITQAGNYPVVVCNGRNQQLSNSIDLVVTAT